MIRILPILFFIFTCASIPAQIDLKQLEKTWNNKELHDTTRLKALDDLIWYGYVFNDPDSARVLSKIQLNLATTLKDANSKPIQNFANRYRVKALIMIGESYHNQSDFEKALEHLSQAGQISKTHGFESSLAAVHSNIGMLYSEQKDNEKAMESLSMAADMFKKTGNIEGLLTTNVSITNIYLDYKEYEKAIALLRYNIKEGKKIGNYQVVAHCYRGLGNSYWEWSDSLKLAGKESLSRAYLDTAEKYFVLGVDASRESGNLLDQAAVLGAAGQFFSTMNKHSRALEYGTEAYELARESKIVRVQGSAAEVLYRSHKALSHPEKALEYMQIWISMKDSIRSEENAKAAIRQQMEFEYEKKAMEDSIRQAEEARVKDAQLAAEQAKNRQNQLEADQRREQSYFLAGGLVLAVLFGAFVFNRFRLTRKQKEIIEKQKTQVDEAFEQLEYKNKEIMDSITYAQRIQSAILPPSRIVKEYFKDSFILYKPKDIVAGDFYWLETTDDTIYFAAADCTGHGVPGAMVSVVCHNALNRAVREHGLSEPGEILDKVREIVMKEFGRSENEIKDGMDIGLVGMSADRTFVKFAGANNPLWIVKGTGQRSHGGGEQAGSVTREPFDSDSALIEIKADKQPIGKFSRQTPFTTHEVDVEQGDTIYLFTDGYIDQFGGPKGKKFKSANFKKLLLSMRDRSLPDQKTLINQEFDEWKGDLEQIDDVCIIGVKL